MVGVAHVEQLAAQREDAVVVAPDDREAGDGEGLGRVALGDDQRTLAAVLATSLIGVVELRDAREPLLLGTVGLLELLTLRLWRDGWRGRGGCGVWGVWKGCVEGWCVEGGVWRAVCGGRCVEGGVWKRRGWGPDGVECGGVQTCLF